MKTLNDIINWIINSGFLALLIYIAVAFVKPWADSKVKHAKTAQQKKLWTQLEQVSMTVVNSLVGKDMTGQAKFAEAVTQVQAYLENKGLNVDMKQVEAAVQSAYEKSPLTTPPTQSTVHVTADGITTTVGPFAKHIPAGDLKPASVNPADMPGAQKTPAKSKVPTNAIAKKGIPTDNLKDVAVQTPQPEPQGDDADANKD